MADTLGSNRFQNLPLIVRLAIRLLLLACLLTAIELGSFAVLWSYNRARGGATDFAPLINRFHPLFRRQSPPSQYVFDPYLGLRNRPNYRVYETLATDADGFIKNDAAAPDVSVAKPPNVVRIFILGGSAVAGSGLAANNLTIASELERYLNRDRARKTRVEVVNAGVSSYTSALELVYAQVYLSRYDPDIVVTLDGWNDFFASSNAGLRSDKPQWIPYHYSLAEAYEQVQSAPRTVGLLMANVRRMSYFATLMSLATRSFQAPEALDGPPPTYSTSYAVNAAALEDYVHNVRGLAGSMGANGVLSLHVLQPNVVTRQPPLDAELTYLEPIGSRTSYLAAARQWFQAARVQFAAMQSSPPNDRAAFLDFTDTFDGTSDTMYLDYVHYNVTGSRLLAQRLGREIEQRILPDGSWAWTRHTDAVATFRGTPAVRVNQLVGEKALLEGYDIVPGTKPGERVHLRLYWADAFSGDLLRARRHWVETPPEGSLLDNGDFESGTAATYPAGWTAEIYGDTQARSWVTITDGVPGRENHALILKTSGAAHRLGLQSMSFAVEPGSYYLVSGRVRSDRGSSQAAVLWQGPTVTDAFRYHYLIEGYGGPEWKQFATVVQPAAGASQCVLWVMNSKPDSAVSFDDLLFVRIRVPSISK